MHKYFFITTNNTWGGSEKLWYESVLLFLSRKVPVALAASYEHEKIDALKSKLSFFVDIKKRYTLLSRPARMINKFAVLFKSSDELLSAMKKFQPHLVIICQGNNISSYDIMELCFKNNFRYVTIAQVVTELNWFWLDESLHTKLVYAFNKAVKNYFVSKGNLALHKFIFTYDAENAEIIYNPFKTSESSVEFPATDGGYKMAVVGRVECFHKGLDILLHVLANEKWQSRPVSINLYGSGPHVLMIKNLLLRLKINNVFLKGYNADIDEIWSHNHILLQPSRLEGQSLALLEALNLNRSAIVTRVGGTDEVIENNVTGFMANNATIEELDDAMERAWNRKNEWEEIGITAGNKFRKITPDDPIDYFNSKITALLN